MDMICFGSVEELNLTLVTAPQDTASLAEWHHYREAF